MNGFGRIFRVSVFGESHGAAIGVVLDGVPAGIPLSEADFETDIDRRRSGAQGTTPRREADCPEFLSGVYNAHTTGAPLTVVFRNGNVRSDDYDLFKVVPRPGHADYVASVKWNGYNDPRGGGHFSGRLTLPVVAAGVVAKKILKDIKISASLIEVGGISCRPINGVSCEPTQADGDNFLPQSVKDALDKAVLYGDSLGGIVECSIEGLPIGLGEPFFDSVESLISHAVFSIPGVRGIEFGDGFRAARMNGSEHNDPFGTDGKPTKNGAGGVNGGISNGAPVVFRTAFKPTSSIRRMQHTTDLSVHKSVDFSVPGRHDACFVLRTPVVVEAMVAIVIADLCGAKLERL